MNKTLFLLIPFVLLYSCSKKNTPSPNRDSKVNLVGAWTIVADTEYQFQNNQVVKASVPSGPFAYLLNLDFKTNDTVVYTVQTNTAIHDYATYKLINNNAIVFYHFAELWKGPTNGAYVDTLAIKKYTQNSLVLTFNDDESNPNRAYEISYYTKQ